MSVVERIGPESAAGRARGEAAVRPPRRLSPLGATAVTVYATLLCLALAIPGSVVSALRDAPPSPLTETALRIATAAELGLDATGLPGLYRAAKERFRQAACGAPDSANPC